MPKKPISAAAAYSNRLYQDMNKVAEELNLPNVAKPTPGSGVDEDFNKLDLPTISSKMLSRYLQYASGMHCFALVCASKSENHSQAVHEALSRRIAELRLLYDDGQQKYKLDAQVDQDTQITKLKDAALKADAVCRLYKAYVSAFDARVNLLSREISRRAAETNKGG